MSFIDNFVEFVCRYWIVILVIVAIGVFIVLGYTGIISLKQIMTANNISMVPQCPVCNCSNMTTIITGV